MSTKGYLDSVYLNLEIQHLGRKRQTNPWIAWLRGSSLRHIFRLPLSDGYSEYLVDIWPFCLIVLCQSLCFVHVISYLSSRMTSSQIAVVYIFLRICISLGLLWLYRCRLRNYRANLHCFFKNLPQPYAHRIFNHNLPFDLAKGTAWKTGQPFAIDLELLKSQHQHTFAFFRFLSFHQISTYLNKEKVTRVNSSKRIH